MFQPFIPNLTKKLTRTIESGWINEGPAVEEFENKFGKKFGYKYPVATNSGTSALELAYHLCGIRPGDEVIVPVLTSPATNIPLIRKGARIVFADVDDDLNPSSADIKQKITSKTKLIVTVNLNGIPCDDEIFKLGVPVVVDACQSLGIPEPRGDFQCYSFQAIKHFTTGDGGMLCVGNNKEYNMARKLRWFGLDRKQKPGKMGRLATTDIADAGYKFHMNDIAATMGIEGIKHSNKILAHRKRIAKIYKKISWHISPCRGSLWSYFIYTIEKDNIFKSLKKNGIESGVVNRRNDTLSIFGNKKRDVNYMNVIEDEYLHIPIGPHVSLEQAKIIVEVINSV